MAKIWTWFQINVCFGIHPWSRQMDFQVPSIMCLLSLIGNLFRPHVRSGRAREDCTEVGKGETVIERCNCRHTKNLAKVYSHITTHSRSGSSDLPFPLLCNLPLLFSRLLRDRPNPDVFVFALGAAAMGGWCISPGAL